MASDPPPPRSPVLSNSSGIESSYGRYLIVDATESASLRSRHRDIVRQGQQTQPLADSHSALPPQ